MWAAPPHEGSVAGACGKGGRAGRVGIRPRRRARDRFFFSVRQGVLSFSPRRAPAAHHPCFSLSSTPQTVGNSLSIAPQAEAGARLVAPLAPALVAKALLDHRDKVKKKKSEKKERGRGRPGWGHHALGPGPGMARINAAACWCGWAGHLGRPPCGAPPESTLPSCRFTRRSPLLRASLTPSRSLSLSPPLARTSAWRPLSAWPT